MTTVTIPSSVERKTATDTMRALVFRGPNQIAVERVPIPKPGPGEAVIRVTLTTICGTDVHILKGEYPVQPGLVIGHEPVGVIHELGVGVTGYKIGDRVLVGAITAWEATLRNAAARSAAGNSATPLTERRLNIFWSQVLKPTWRKFPTNSRTSKWYYWPTSLRQAFPRRKARTCKLATRQRYSLRGPSDCAQPQAQN
jgi:hypothetical protein